MLFSNLETIPYNLNGKQVTILDIFRNISIQDVSGNAFEDYFVQEGETPESVSFKFYGVPGFSWLVMMCNNFADINNEWYPTAQKYEAALQRDYGGNAYYIANLPDIQEGDIIVKVDGTSDLTTTSVDIDHYRQIVSFDKNLRKIRGISGAGEINTGDLVAFARKLPSGEITPITFGSTGATPQDTDYAEVLHTETYLNSLSYFYISTAGTDAGKVEVSPYRIVSSGTLTINSLDPSETYTDPTDTVTSNFSDTVLYDYMVNAGLPTTTNIRYKYLSEELVVSRFQSQKIKVLKADYLNSVMATIQTALETNQIGRSFKVLV
jgi:hypothetical protein